MPADFTPLDTAMAALRDQLTATEGTEANAVVLINGFAAQVTKAVADALTADNAADATSIAAATAAIEERRARFEASRAALAAAIDATPPA